MTAVASCLCVGGMVEYATPPYNQIKPLTSRDVNNFKNQKGASLFFYLEDTWSGFSVKWSKKYRKIQKKSGNRSKEKSHKL